MPAIDRSNNDCRYQILCGSPPFAGDGRDAIQNVQSGRYSFPEAEWRFISDSAMDLIKRMLLRKDPTQRCTTADLLNHDWVSGEYFRVLKANVDGAFDTAATGQLSGTARRLRLHNSKRKFRSGIRAIMAENALEGLLAGLEKEKVLVSIGQSYDAEKLKKLYVRARYVCCFILLLYNISLVLILLVCNRTRSTSKRPAKRNGTPDLEWAGCPRSSSRRRRFQKKGFAPS